MASAIMQKIINNLNTRSIVDILVGGPTAWFDVINRVRQEFKPDDLNAAVSLALPLSEVKRLMQETVVLFEDIRLAKAFSYDLPVSPKGIFAGPLYSRLNPHNDDTKNLFIAGPTSDAKSGKLNNGVEGPAIHGQNIEVHKGGIILNTSNLMVSGIFLPGEHRDPNYHLYVGTALSFEIPAESLQELEDLEVLTKAVDICIANGYIGSYNNVQGFLIVDESGTWQYTNTVTPLRLGDTLASLLDKYISINYPHWHEETTGYSVIWAVYTLLSCLKDKIGNTRVVLLEESSVSVPVTMIKRNLPLYFYV